MSGAAKHHSPAVREHLRRHRITYGQRREAELALRKLEALDEQLRVVLVGQGLDVRALTVVRDALDVLVGDGVPS